MNDSVIDRLVVGSGPAGVSAASALAARGLKCVVVEPGLELEPEKRALAREATRIPVEEWDDARRAALAGNVDISAGGVGKKLVFGSDFAYRAAGPLTLERDGADLDVSHARGGLGNVWGAAIGQYRREDLAGWPVRHEELAPYYDQVAEFMPVCGEHDGLDELFPLPARHGPLPKISPQLDLLYKRLDRRKAALSARGLTWGRARVALESGCVECGRCLTGCPFDLIYNPASRLERLRRDGAVDYRPGLWVESVKERTDGVVEVSAVVLKDGSRTTLKARKLFLAAGAIASTRVLMKSLGLSRARLRDSRIFHVPFLNFRGAPGFDERPFTLTQGSLEWDEPALSPHPLHYQIYAYNDFYSTLIAKLLGPLAAPARPATRAFLSRFMIFQGYLHSDQSGPIELELVSGGADGDRLRLSSPEAPATEALARKAARAFLKHARAFGGVPLLPLFRLLGPGRGFHFGGSFPMSASPKDGECDALGRPKGFRNLHLVDAAAFPTIPAAPITYTIMANAYRIAERAAKEPA
ncbi:MAG: GMC family oxidoreductase [Elusimicrobia bacterium]|nr:GMC family oxidoreductase [Elusimicrobiota bacterium]